MRKIIPFPVFIFIFVLTVGLSPTFSAPKLKADRAAIKIDPGKLPSKAMIEIDALNGLSAKYIDSNQVVSFDLATKALRLAKLINYKKGEAYANVNLGYYYYIKKTYLKALEYFMASLKYAEANDNAVIMNEVNKGMGLICLALGRRERSIEYERKGMIYAKKKNNIVDLIGGYIILGQIMFEQGDTNEAFKLYFKALSLKPKLTKVSQQIWVMKSIGNLYLSTKEYDIALYYYREAIKENPKDLGNFNGTIYSIIAHTYEQKNDLDNALRNNKIALAFRKKENQQLLVISSLLNIGHIYLRIGNYDSSLYYLETGLKDANFFKINFLREAGYKYLYELYLAKKDWKNALSALQTYNSAQVIVENEKSKDQVTLMENNLIVNEKEKQTEILRAENAIQKLEMKNRNLMVLLLITLSLLTIAVAIYIQQLLIKNKKAKKIVEDINDQLQDEIKEHVIQNEELSRREQEYRFLADHSADLITLMDSNFKCLYISPSSEFFLGYSPEELLSLEDYRDLIHPDSRKSFSLEFDSMMDYRDATRFVYQAIKKDGSAFWVESNINPIFESSTGKLKAMLSVTRDVSSQIDQEEAMMEAARQKELLIKEVHHRVKNNLAILTSLVNMQKNEFTDHKTLDIFSDLQFRVRAMALVHEQLYKSRNIEVLPIGEYLSKLVGIVSSAYANKRVEVHQDFFDEIVDVEITLPLGLIVNELLTNAYKYAFPDNKEGNIWVTYKKAPRRKKSTVEMRCLTVRDDGIGLPPDFDLSQRTSMGSQIIHLLTKQLEGKIKTDGTKGASFSIILPSER
jgi:PAS domain S-box-containing protein